MTEVTDTKWYDKKWLVAVLCVLFFPVGLYALWMSRTIGQGWKIGVTIFIALVVFASIGGDENKNASAEVSQSAPELTTAQKDSIAKVEQVMKDSLAKTERLRMIEERRNGTISSNDLWASYNDNEVRADENFKNKIFYVSGTVTNIGKNLFDDIEIRLEGDGMFGHVACEVTDKSVAAQLEKGQWITLRGKCSGLTITDVFMKECVVVENLEDLESQ
jgi:hypothetical protein